MAIYLKTYTLKNLHTCKMKRKQKYQQIVLPPDSKKNFTTGQRAADQLTRIVGSWGFIIGVFVLLAIWMFLNATAILFPAWDRYPFILLNFILSCTAAIQAPIILMSQNRINERDRLRQNYDYLIDRKAEREIQEIKIEVKKIAKILNIDRLAEQENQEILAKLHKLEKQLKIK